VAARRKPAAVKLISIKPRHGKPRKPHPTLVAKRTRLLADPILTNGWGAELLAPGFTRPEFKPSQSFRPVPIIRPSELPGNRRGLVAMHKTGLPSVVVCIGPSRAGKKGRAQG
jgi:hypothetical protein